MSGPRPVCGFGTPRVSRVDELRRGVSDGGKLEGVRFVPRCGGILPGFSSQSSYSGAGRLIPSGSNDWDAPGLDAALPADGQFARASSRMKGWYARLGSGRQVAKEALAIASPAMGSEGRCRG